MVAKPVGIRTVLSSVPSWTGHDGGDPRRYFKLGRFTMGNTDGFQFSHGIEYGQQLLYPMPPVWELLAYDIKNGASCLFQELVDVPDLSLKAPWDRTPSLMHASSVVVQNGGASGATLWSYTVPVGRRLWLSQANAYVRRIAAATTPSYAYVLISLEGLQLVYADLRAGITTGEVSDSLHGSHIIVSAGQQIIASGQNGDTGGTVMLGAECNGFLFDA